MISKLNLRVQDQTPKVRNYVKSIVNTLLKRFMKSSEQSHLNDSVIKNSNLLFVKKNKMFYITKLSNSNSKFYDFSFYLHLHN